MFRHRVEREALARRTTTVLFGRPCYVATPDDLVVYKLIASRPQDLADIDRMLRLGVAPQDAAYIERWAKAWGVGEVWKNAQAATRR